jgi:NhaP-type Na+/H+ or K+/H+ antiporter
VLVGQEAHAAVRSLPTSSTGRAVGLVLATTAVVIGTRWAWLYTTPYLLRALDRRPAQRARRVGARQRTVNAVTGFRGAVSLAAALAVPHTLADGTPFPDRDLIVVITSGVIVLTLLQALVLPAAVRFARLPPDSSVAEEHDDQYTALRLALIARERGVLLQLRDDRSIDDIVLGQVQDVLDLEEVRLVRAAPAE